ncbi:MAG: radical SAM/SPASM domain-containing protein [Nannocystaceae bacterium]|nr:radical SAM protein [bacterium]
MLRRLEMIARLSETWFHRPPSPTRVVFDVTRRCNLRCAMCRTWEHPGTGALTAEEIERILGQLPRLTWLDMTGGEPFVRPDIERVLRAGATVPRGLTVFHFQTNGWLSERVEAVTAAVRAAREDIELIVTVSIDGPPEVHDAVRGREGSAARALETLDRLGRLPGVEVHVGTTVSSQTAGALGRTEAMLRARGFDLRRWHWNWLQTSAHFFGNTDIEPKPVVPGDLLRRHMARRGVPRTMVELMESIYLLNLDAVARGEDSGVPCQALRSAAFISPEGQLYPCHLYDRPLGSLREHSVAALWHGHAVAKARDDIDALACGGCFSACEAYPALAGAPVRTATVTAARLLRRLRENA